MTMCPNCGYTNHADLMPLTAEQVADLKRCVYEWTGTSGDLWLSPTRVHRAVRARRVAIEIMRHRWGLSLSDIGRVLGQDHTTVIAQLKKPLPDRVDL